MPAPIALQLYTVRELAAKDYAATVRKVAEIGYVGVEPAGFPGTTACQAAKLFKSLGLEVCSAHMPLPVGERQNQVLDDAGMLGIKRLVSGFGPDRFTKLDDIKKACDVFSLAGEIAASHGMSFSIHNHWWEFQKLAGTDRWVYEIMLEHLSPTVCFQIDTYWVKVGGADPVSVIKKIGKRAPLLHIKDGPGVKDQPMLAAGTGVMDFPSIVKAAAKTADWHIIELDRCATDMMTAVAESYAYMVGKGLSRGNK
jgi:sugar phosphate isomerase/epimerase